ncbi:MAG: DUF6494 family protein [Thiohalophilus sp.]|uniref:DUF6494 family protein n=1 Tax=Thiohalophilus sp. TaxID=3028392 RepID=UPI0028705107|nr:DUF6494 family protein [Thiohalophilus sp.]MDR9436843.1 DUF6494 family protein [Thiohalophilus sp.]
MNEEALNTQTRRFLKKVGIQSQQAIEKAVRDALKNGQLQGDETLEATVQLEIPELDLTLQIRGDIALEDQDE